MPDEKRPPTTAYRRTSEGGPESPVPQPTTKEIPAMTDRALLEDLTRVVKAGFSEMRTDIGLVSNDLQVVKDRVVILENFRTETEARSTRHSGGARQLSENDARQDAELSKEREAREALAAEVATIKTEVTGNKAMMERVDKAVTGLLSNPKVKFLGAVIWMLITGYLAKRGLEVPR